MAYLKRSGERLLDPVIDDGQAGVHLVRGGSWFFPSEDLAATVRGKNEADQPADDIGFRLALLQGGLPALEAPRLPDLMTP